MLVPAGAVVMQWMKTLQEFPPRQKPASFSVGDVMAKLEQNKQALAAAAK
jgi:arylsulfatase